MKRILILLLLPVYVDAQPIPKDANVIVVKGVDFKAACNVLLDKGYLIEKRDTDLQTAKTEKKYYQRTWSVAYIINLRVRDSVVYISGTITAPVETGTVFNDTPIRYFKNKNNIMGHAFSLMQDVALSMGKPVEYMKQ